MNILQAFGQVMWVSIVCVLPVLLAAVAAIWGACRFANGAANDAFGDGDLNTREKIFKAWTGLLLLFGTIILGVTICLWLDANGIKLGSYQDFKASIHPAPVAVQAEEAK